jgi:hypothetical protein
MGGGENETGAQGQQQAVWREPWRGKEAGDSVGMERDGHGWNAGICDPALSNRREGKARG